MMKSILSVRITLLHCILVLVIVACNKVDHAEDAPGQNQNNTTNATDSSITDSTYTINYPPVNVTTCPSAPNYGDSIVFIKPKLGADFILDPVNNKGTSGTYLSWPEGLQLNQNTGAINLSKSETGIRYNIAFIKKGTTDTCVSQLIVGGLTYLDGIYILDQNDTLALPIFNADPFAAPVCNTSNDTDYPDNNGNGDNKCTFDDDAPGQRANDQKLRVRTKSGIINLKRSVADGLFGKNPKDGAKKMLQIRYALNDASQKASQKISVQVIYYDKASSIPTNLQQEVTTKRANLFQYKIVNGKPRPPLLIIAGYTK
ncbi:MULTISPECIES: hypothetical protein [Niastella]|uniref:Uncharacterized protein n=1 Tax=Niastella soli TaxID=2821487 RepID=A0ABS3YVM7_9BACT|nr:hypothetical protein [Niastella soli]MBO9201918.1 hypothetical protein [Niastella soli]